MRRKPVDGSRAGVTTSQRLSLKQADYHWAVLARICSVAAERGWISVNPCTKGGRVYTSNRQELIWLTEDEERFYEGAPHHMSLGGSPGCLDRTAPRRPAADVLVKR